MMRGEMDADSYQSNIVSDVRMCDSSFSQSLLDCPFSTLTHAS